MVKSKNLSYVFVSARLALVYVHILVCLSASIHCTSSQSSLPQFYAPEPLEQETTSSCPSLVTENLVRNNIGVSIIPLLENLQLSEFVPTTIETASVPTEPPGPTLFTCKGTPGWRRVTLIDLRNRSQLCPPGLRLTTFSRRTCGKNHINPGCSSTVFNVGGFEYNQVCGRITGYQFGLSHAFFENFLNRELSIESHYVSGVSLTHGQVGSRRHIWTFAAGLSENDMGLTDRICPCDQLSQQTPHSFVGSDYFCESGSSTALDFPPPVFYANDPLWDGQGCLPISSCCQFNTPPWFTRNLPNPTTDDIELRICTITVTQGSEESPLELVELYVK